MGRGKLIGGAVLVLAGVLLTITGIGAIIGIPVAILGYAVMFPNFREVLVILAVLASIVIAISLFF